MRGLYRGTASCRFLSVEIVNFGGESRGDCVAFEFSVSGEQTIFHTEWLGDQMERANLLVMRQIGIQRIQRRLDLLGFRAIAVGSRRGEQSCERTAAIADENHMLRFRH